MTEQTAITLPPHSVEAERAILGAIFIDPALWYTVAGQLTAQDFYIVRHGWIFEAMTALLVAGSEIDNVTVCDELKRRGQLDEVGGVATIIYLEMKSPGAVYAARVEAYLNSYIGIVQRAAFRRSMLVAASELAKLAYQEADDIDDVKQQAQTLLFTLFGEGQNSQSADAAQISSETFDRVEAAYLAHQRGEVVGLPTGIKEIDDLIGGLIRDKFYVVAGRPGMGKTAWVLTIMFQLVKAGVPVGLFSLEMDRTEVQTRFVAMETGLSTTKLERGDLTPDEFALFVEGNARVGAWPFWVDHTPANSITSIRTQAQAWYMEHGIKLVLVDYLQLATGDENKSNRVLEIGDISRGLKALARRLHIPVLAAAQLNREVEKRADKRPYLSDLRESGDIENDADVVCLLYRDDYYNANSEKANVTECRIAKQRSGPPGTAEMYFRREVTQFADLSKKTISLPDEQAKVIGPLD